MEIIVKHDYLQATGSFKERGARNALACLTPAQRLRGVVAASAGNHALGLAWHGRELGVPVTVVMPRNAPRVKAGRCHTLGARVVLQGNTYDEASAYALALADDQGLAYVHPFDDLAVIAGQGTLALEALLAEPDVDAFVVPVGGGGLLAGVATVVKALRPHVQVIGVEPAHAAGLTAARHAGRPVRTTTLPTFADGLAVAQTGAHTFAHAQARADDVVTVSEDDLALALLAAHESHGLVLEGAGVAGLAACLAGRLPALAGKRVLVALTGANIDPANHARALTRARVLREESLCAGSRAVH
jgi:threonine dehydratase